MRKLIVSDLFKMVGSSLIAALVTIFTVGRWVGVSEASVRRIDESEQRNAAEVTTLRKEVTDLKEFVIRVDQKMVESQQDRAKLNRLMEERAKADETILVKLSAIEAKLNR